MKIALKDFQLDTLVDLKRQLRFAKSELRQGGDPQAIVLSSPTGSGKTVMIAALMEHIVRGDEPLETERDAVFLWLTDQPELNKQSRDRILATSDRFRESDMVIIEAGSFDQETFSGGKVYFLNTQKLGKDKNLVTHGDLRTYTIWETIQNTSNQLGDKFYVIIDEAHRGMQTSANDERQAQTIMQKFILGSPGEMTPPRLVLGISATPQRFQRLLEQTTVHTSRQIRHVNVNPLDVRDSGLLKDTIILYHPEDDQPSDWSLLAEAARKWKQMRDRWNEYTHAQELPSVHPAMVIQVEDQGENAITRTSLAQAIQVLETEIGPIDDGELAHSFQEDTVVEVGGIRKIRKIDASLIQEDPQAKFIFFKMSLTTGWDCPRAEVMMSFRKAKDHTLIAQLVGRMVRTPLARRVEQQEFLNTVSLYLPYYDAAGLEKVVNSLKGDPEIVPPADVEMGNEQVTLHLNPAVGEDVLKLLNSLPTYRVEKVRKIPDASRLIRFARLLTHNKIDENALNDAKAFIVQLLNEERKRLIRHDPDFALKVKSKSQITIQPTTIEQGIWKSLPGELENIPVTRANVEDLFKRAGQRMGEGLHMEYWKANAEKGDHNQTKLELFLILQDEQAWKTLEAECNRRINELFKQHSPAIRELPSSEREKFDQIKTIAKGLEPIELSLPSEILLKQAEGGEEYSHHLYLQDDGRFLATFNTWEDAVIRQELQRGDVVCWLRNIDRKPWALCVPYQKGGVDTPAYPDFLVVRRNQAGNLVVDILEPHSSELKDNWTKAKGLADFATRHSFYFDRIELIRREANGVLKRLNINDETNRKKVLAVNTNELLDSIFDGM